MSRPSCYRTVSEIIAALNVRISTDKLKDIEKGGGTYTYIPWETATRELDRIYGPFGWSTTPMSFSGDAASGIYLAALTLTVTAIDDETGIVVTKSAAGFGRGIAQASKDDKKKDPSATVASSLITHDTAASSAGSDALSKASKQLGDAFGLFLYDKDDPASGQSKGGNGRAQQNNLGARPNAEQERELTQAGNTPNAIKAMPEKVWQARLAAITKNAPQSRQNTQQPAQPTSTPVPPVAPSESQQNTSQVPTPIDDKAWCEQWREKHNVPKNVMSGYCRCQGWQTSTQIRAVLEKSTDDTLIDIEQYQRSIAS